MHQIQNATQMGYRFHGLSAQFEMKLPGLFTECIERVFNVMGAHATPHFQGFKAMFRQREFLIAVIASLMTGHQLAAVNDPDL
jgi:hypothetical protein